jgi:hypothetical protein
MSRCETCQRDFSGEGGRFCSAQCRPDFGKGPKHPGTPRFPGRRAARRRRRRGR